MKRRSGKSIVRKKNIYLPTEVWVDVFCYAWIACYQLTKREAVAQMVDKIGNRWFGEQLQFYLHEWGKHTLQPLYFKQKGVEQEYDFFQFRLLEYPQTAMPENIKFCKSFRIDYFDNRMFNFFRRIQSVLTADTNIEIYYTNARNTRYGHGYADANDLAEQLNNARTILRHLLPLIDGIHTMFTDDRMLPIVKQFPRVKFHQIKVFRVELTRFVQSTMQPITEWLTASNEPKLLELYSVSNEIAKRVMETIRKQFMGARKPSTFAVIFFNNYDLPDFQCENGAGEQLCGCRDDDIAGYKVFRHKAKNAEAGEKLRELLDENMDKDGTANRKQCIRLCKPKIGLGRIFALPDLDETDEKEDEAEKPSTSKKRRICK